MSTVNENGTVNETVNEIEKHTPTIQQETQPTIVKPEFNIRISTDQTMVYLRLKSMDQSQEVSPEDIKNFLAEQGVVFGICEENIKQFCEKKSFFLELVAAKGIEPIDGTNGKIIYHFDTALDNKPSERDDGTVDFRELGLVKNVKKDELLVHVEPPIEGRDGTNVFGGPLPYIRGKLPSISSGKNTVLSEDNLQLTATIDGAVELNEHTIVVNEIIDIRGDVDMHTGNIDCVGSVVVRGDVREGFCVKSGNNIEVHGIVEGAELEAAGSITIRSGINGMNHGKITAGQNITSNYIQNANIECGGSVSSESIINSNIIAGENILLKGKKASLVGGNYQAGKMICAKYIGSTGYMQTILTLSVPDFEAVYDLASQNNPRELEQEINACDIQLKELQTTIKNKSSQLNQDGNVDVIAKLIMKKNKVAVRMTSLAEKKKSVLEAMDKLINYKIVATDTIFPGCKISLCNLYFEINQETHGKKYYIKDRAIAEETVSTADKQW